MILESPYRWNCLVPRCRLITTWGCSWCQGLDCSSIKVVRELGLERRETVRSLSSVIVDNFNFCSRVREDREEVAYGVSIIVLAVLLSSYAA